MLFNCKQCNKEFFFEGQLKRHILFDHVPPEKDSDLFEYAIAEARGQLAGMTRPEEDLSVFW